jgi:hypothetical protein
MHSQIVRLICPPAYLALIIPLEYDGCQAEGMRAIGLFPATMWVRRCARQFARTGISAVRGWLISIVAGHIFDPRP